MHLNLIEVLRCPRTGFELSLREEEFHGDRVFSGWLVSKGGLHRYPIRNFIPRFVPASNYADNFGLQWNTFRRTQLDSYSGQKISSDRFWKASGWRPADLAGKWVLDAGCGAGRFAEIAIGAGANVVALDYSSAADACLENLGHHPNLHVVQGDIFALPFSRAWFPFVYSLGVLQHLPNVAGGVASLVAIVAPGGRICIDVYEKTWKSLLLPKYWLRPITTRVPKARLFEFLRASVPMMLPISRRLGMVPAVGRMLQRLVPVADYSRILSLTDRQHREWALLDTFDWLAPEYDNPQTAATIMRWLEEAGLEDPEVLRAGHLVGRGRRSEADHGSRSVGAE